MYQRIRGLIQGERFWMVVASLALRGQAFLVGLWITRLYGPAGLGLYAATLNVAASLVTPLTGIIQNNAGWMSAVSERKGSRSQLIRIHVPWLLGGGMLALMGVLALASSSGLPLPGEPGGGWVLLAAASVVFYQLFNALGQGLLQGVGGFIRPAQASVALTLVLTLASWPAIRYMGVPGAYVVLAFGSLLLPALALALYLRAQPVVDSGAISRPEAPSPSVSLLLRRWWSSWPTAMSALVSSVVTWLCLVYLVHRAHGAEGIGWVSLGVQWGTLMLLPVTSWGGLTMKRVMNAVDRRERTGLLGVITKLAVYNGVVTLVLALAVVGASGLLGWLYRLPTLPLAELLLLTAAYAVLGSINNVFERLFFCMHEQRSWMWLTSLGAVVQVAVTWWWIDASYLAVAAGLAVGACLTAVGGGVWLARLAKERFA